MSNIEFARKLRKNQTEAEKQLWRQLRAKRFFGFKFRRQHPIGPYVVDFVCLNEKLVIELDGGQHSETPEYDRKRTAYIENLGFTVVRFWNNEVMGNIDGVMEVLRQRLLPPP